MGASGRIINGTEYQWWALVIYFRTDLNKRLQVSRFYSNNGQIGQSFIDKTCKHGPQNNGNAMSIANYKDNSRNQTFTYDALNRRVAHPLISFSIPHANRGCSILFRRPEPRRFCAVGRRKRVGVKNVGINRGQERVKESGIAGATRGQSLKQAYSAEGKRPR